MILAPILAFVLLVRLLVRKVDLRTAILAAMAALGVFVVVATEGLSAFDAVTRAGVGTAWIVLALALLGVDRLLPRAPLNIRPISTQDVRRYASSNPLEAALLVATVTLVGLVFVTAIVAPPNTWDVMDYHMTRVIMWIQHRNVRLFTSPDYSHAVFAPWAEYGLLHFDLLWGGDRFVNLVEWGSMVGSLIGASVIARDLGAGPRGQILAAFLVSALPEGVLEASGAMNTYVISLWGVIACVFLLRCARFPTMPNVLGGAAALGLAVLTKGSAYVYMPFMVLGVWAVGTKTSRLYLLKAAPVILLVVVALNGPHALREYQFTGSPLGLPFPAGGIRLHWSNDRITLTGTISNILRNLSLHAVMPVGGRINAATESAVRTLIRAIGADPDDTANTWLETQWFSGYHLPPTWLQRHETFTGNPPQLALGFVSGYFLLADRSRTISWQTKVFALSIALSFTLYCALLRWQIWGGRHQLPLFVFGCAVLGVALATRLSTRVLAVLSAVTLVWSLNCALRNWLRPLVPEPGRGAVTQPREVQYFADQHDAVAATWIEAAGRIRASQCRDVGIDEGEHFFVYPLLALIGADTGGVHVRYIGVDNLTAQYAPKDASPPCIVACLACGTDAARAAPHEARLGEGVAFENNLLFGVSAAPRASSGP